MGGNATVITYHGVGDCPPSGDPFRMFMPIAKFDAHLAYLARRRTVVPLDSIVDGRLPAGRKAVAITFDDGYRSVLNKRCLACSATAFPPRASSPRSGSVTRIAGKNSTPTPAPCRS